MTVNRWYISIIFFLSWVSIILAPGSMIILGIYYNTLGAIIFGIYFYVLLIIILSVLAFNHIKKN